MRTRCADAGQGCPVPAGACIEIRLVVKSTWKGKQIVNAGGTASIIREVSSVNKNTDAAENKPNWKIVETIRESDDVTSVVVEADRDLEGCHTPGQFATLRVMTDKGWSNPHPFTISCAPGGNRLRFTIKGVDEFTRSVPDWTPGAMIRCEGPFGVFCRDIDNQEHIVMIAGGVGITPFLSVLRHFRETRAKNRVTLFWANRTVADAFARDELAAMTRELDLTVVHAVSREDPTAVIGPDDATDRIVYEKGRITRDMLQRHLEDPKGSFYVCGPPEMQEAVLKELAECGVDPDAVQKERFTVR